MNRSRYFDYIEEKINFLSYRIQSRSRINLLELNIHSETFFAEMLNKLLHLQLKNMNAVKQNVEGIDLVDEYNKVIAQVSSTNTKCKVENSLKKGILKTYGDYRFIFIPLVGDSNNLKNKKFNNPYNVRFDPNQDIYDIPTILRIIQNLEINELKQFFTFIREELGSEVEIAKINSNLATIINILAEADLSADVKSPEINCFEIDRKIEFNNLNEARETINRYKLYYGILDEKYKEFDKLGVNKSTSVFNYLFNQYDKLNKSKTTDIKVFYELIDNIIDFIQNSNNYNEISYEELEMCVYIIVVDAFIRCKIFRNPEGYNYVVTR